MASIGICLSVMAKQQLKSFPVPLQRKIAEFLLRTPVSELKKRMRKFSIDPERSWIESPTSR